MPRPYVSWPDPKLRAVAVPVLAVDDDVVNVWEEMLAAMYSMPGVGLAAPQLGIGLRLAVLDCSDRRDQPIRLANPELLGVSDTLRKGQEGSPNLPGHFAEITRPNNVEVRFLNDEGNVEERSFSGLWATSIQHQIDHLNGKMFFDRLSALARRRFMDKVKKEAKKSRRRR